MNTAAASALHRVQLGLLEALGHEITVVFEIGSGAALPRRSSWHLEVFACDSMTPQQRQSAKAAILAAVEDHRVGFTFQHVGIERTEGHAEFSCSLRPAVLTLNNADDRRLIGFRAQATDRATATIARIVSLIRFGGHLPKGGYDVQNGITQTAPLYRHRKAHEVRYRTPIAISRFSSPDSRFLRSRSFGKY